MPEGAGAAHAMYSLRASLLLLAEQDTPAAVTWEDLAAAHLHWTDTCKLVPFHVIEESVAGVDAACGPAKDQVVPRRVLELLRKQLDAIVVEWTTANATKVALAEQEHSHSTWAQTVLSQAKRMQELKRPAASEPDSGPQLRRQPDSGQPSASRLKTEEPTVAPAAAPAEPPADSAQPAAEAAPAAEADAEMPVDS